MAPPAAADPLRTHTSGRNGAGSSLLATLAQSRDANQGCCLISSMPPGPQPILCLGSLLRSCVGVHTHQAHVHIHTPSHRNHDVINMNRHAELIKSSATTPPSRHTHTHKHTKTDRETERQRDRETERQRDRETERQRDR